MQHINGGPSHGPFDSVAQFRILCTSCSMWQACSGGTHLDALLSGIHVNASYGILDVNGIHLHAAIAGALRWRPSRYHRASTPAESLAIAIELSLFAITELRPIAIDLCFLHVARLLDLREGHIVVVRCAVIVARVLHVRPHLRYLRMIHYPSAGTSLYVSAGKVAALQFLVEAIFRGAVIHIWLIAGISLGSQLQLGTIVDALHPVGILQHPYGQAASIEAGLELVVGLWTWIWSSRLNEAWLNFWTAVATESTVARAVRFAGARRRAYQKGISAFISLRRISHLHGLHGEHGSQHASQGSHG